MSLQAVRPQDLETAPPFSTLFDIDPDLHAEITRSMKKDGYHTSKPIRVWEDAFGTPGRRVVIDGHTRLGCAKEARLPEVTIDARKYASSTEAFMDAVREQRVRRNLTRDQIAAYALKALRELSATGDRLPTRKKLAQTLGVSEPTVSRAKGVLKNRPDLVEDVLAGKLSLLDAYAQSTKEAKSEAAEAVGEAFAGKATKDERQPSPRGRSVAMVMSVEGFLSMAERHPCPTSLRELVGAIQDLSREQSDAKVRQDVQYALDFVLVATADEIAEFMDSVEG